MRGEGDEERITPVLPENRAEEVSVSGEMGKEMCVRGL